MVQKKTLSDRIWKTANYTVLCLLAFTCVYPFFYFLVLSFNDGKDALRGGIYLWPRMFTFDNYLKAFNHPDILNAMWITVTRTAIVTVTALFLCALLAYALTFKSLPGRKALTFFFYFTTLFGGGLIPTYILYRQIGIMSTYWVLIFPSLYSVWNTLIMRAFFSGLPDSIAESARIDGAGELRIFIRLILPLSLPVLATVGLYIGVGCWNDWFTGQYFIMMRPKLLPAATLLNRLLQETSVAMSKAGDSGASLQLTDEMHQSMSNVTTESLRMTFVIIIVTPIMCIYPFLQKYFVKGALLGSLKG